MRKFTSFFITILFFIWILPLGAFITPEKEEKVCAGQRAVCLCSHLIEKQQKKAADMIVVKNANNANKERSQVSGHHFLFEKDFIRPLDVELPFNEEEQLLHSLAVGKLIEHVPKV